MFERALQHLAQWWSGTFFEVVPSGHIRNRTWDEVQSKLESFGVLYEEDELDDETLEDILGTEIERIRGPKSLMKHALNRYGSRDVSAQLFTSLCRALGIPARLVVSLQSVPWQSSVGKPKPKYVRKDPKGKGKGKAKQVQDDEEEGEDSATTSFAGSGQRLDGAPVLKSEKAKGKEKEKAAPVIKLRKQKDKGRRLGSSTPSTSTNPSRLRKI
jgi:xeroderma pigmentosum group C-complementing protein